LFKFSDGNSLCQDIKTKSIGLIPTKILYKLLKAQIVFMDSVYDENMQFIEFNQVFRPIFVMVVEDELVEDLDYEFMKLPVFDSKINDCLLDLMVYFPEYLSIESHSDIENDEKRDSWVSLKVRNSANFTYQSNNMDDSGIYLDHFIDSRVDHGNKFEQEHYDILKGLGGDINNDRYDDDIDEIQNRLDLQKFDFDSIDSTNIDEFINSIGIKRASFKSGDRRLSIKKEKALQESSGQTSKFYTDIPELSEELTTKNLLINGSTDQINKSAKIVDFLDKVTYTGSVNVINPNFSTTNAGEITYDGIASYINSNNVQPETESLEYSGSAKVRKAKPIIFDSKRISKDFEIKEKEGQQTKESKTDSNDSNPIILYPSVIKSKVQKESKETLQEEEDEEWIKTMKRDLLKKKSIDLTKEVVSDSEFPMNFLGASVIVLFAFVWLKKTAPKMKL
jgi:hypothetical protein